MANDIYKNIKSRHKLKNGTEAEWNSTNIFIPLKGEPIIYNPDETHLHYRYRIGDGVTDVKQLPFVGIIQEGNGKHAIQQILDTDSCSCTLGLLTVQE